MNASPLCFLQVQDLEFAQIEKKVVDGLKIGNQCLKKMHEVGDVQPSVAAPVSLLGVDLTVFFQVLSIEEVERIMDETQDAIEYQRVGWVLHPQQVSPERKPSFLDLFLNVGLSAANR